MNIRAKIALVATPVVAVAALAFAGAASANDFIITTCAKDANNKLTVATAHYSQHGTSHIKVVIDNTVKVDTDFTDSYGPTSFTVHEGSVYSADVTTPDKGDEHHIKNAVIDCVPDTTTTTGAPSSTSPATAPVSTVASTTQPVTTVPATTKPATTAPVSTSPVVTSPATTLPPATTSEPATTAVPTTSPATEPATTVVSGDTTRNTVTGSTSPAKKSDGGVTVLPATGAHIGWWILIALALVILGVTVVGTMKSKQIQRQYDKARLEPDETEPT